MSLLRKGHVALSNLRVKGPIYARRSSCVVGYTLYHVYLYCTGGREFVRSIASVGDCITAEHKECHIETKDSNTRYEIKSNALKVKKKVKTFD